MVLGKGIGVGLPRQRTGGAGRCKCSQCGFVFPHTERGRPCNSYLCPKCKADALIGIK